MSVAVAQGTRPDSPVKLDAGLFRDFTKAVRLLAEVTEWPQGYAGLAELAELDRAITVVHGKIRQELNRQQQAERGKIQVVESIKSLYRGLIAQGQAALAESAAMAAGKAAGFGEEKIAAILQHAEQEQQKPSRTSNNGNGGGKKFRLEIAGKPAGQSYRSNMEIARKLAKMGIISSPYAPALKEETGIDVSSLEDGESVSWQDVTITRIA